MSPPTSQECWDHNRRLYREMMIASSTPRDHQNEAPIAPTQRTQRTRPIDNPRPGAQNLIHSVPCPICSTLTTQRSTPGPYDRRSPYSQSIMGHRAVRRKQPDLTTTQQRAALAPSAYPTISALNLPSSDLQICYYHRTENSAQTSQKPVPPNIDPSLPPTILPSTPTLRQTLTLSAPTVFVVKFCCGCHNLDTCMHYQICFRRDHLPDGLICSVCRREKATQEVIIAKRKCPKHVDDSGKEKKHVLSRLEDILPSEEQRERYEEVMGRKGGGRSDPIVETLGGRGIDPSLRRAGGMGSGTMVPPRRVSRGMAATASPRIRPGARRGHTPAATVPRANIEPLSKRRQLSAEPMMLPPPAWPINSPAPAPPPAQTANQPLFDPVSSASVHASEPSSSTRPPQESTSLVPPQHTLSQAHTEALADSAALALQISNRRSGISNQDDSDEELHDADQTSIETEIPYDLGLFLKNSRMGGQ